MRNVIAILGLVLLAGCAMKTKILDATAVSMTKGGLAEGEKLSETGPVSGKFCPDTWNDKGTFGIIDESVKHAQKEAGVDFILNASIWKDGSCYTVEGTGAKVVASAGASMAAPVTPAPMKAAPKKNK